MCVVCYSAQYMAIFTVNVGSVLQCTVHGHMYNFLCVVCYSAQYILMCTFVVVHCVTVHSIW